MFESGFRRLKTRRGAVVAVLFSLLLSSDALAGGADVPIPGGRFFTQSGGDTPEIDDGYSVIDDREARFWSAFIEHGGVESLGYPVSQRFNWDGYITQVFQKVVFQWRPETGRVAFLNVFDDLNKLGFDRSLESRFIPPQDHFDESDLDWVEIVERRIGLLDAEPALRTAYFSVPNPMLFFGLPQSEVRSYEGLKAIRLQRAILQVWTNDFPWAETGEVTVANGGDIAKELGLWPSEATIPVKATHVDVSGLPTEVSRVVSVSGSDGDSNMMNVPFGGTWLVNWATTGNCVYWATLREAGVDNTFDTLFDASGPSTGTNYLYSKSAGTYFVRLLRPRNGPQCNWSISI